MTERAPLWSEAQLLLEPIRLLRSRRALGQAPRGSGPVLVLPGYLTDDRTTIPLRWWLANRGYEPQGWGLGVNRGGIRSVIPRLVETLDRLGPTALIGWSWGGVIAREVGRDRPDLVRQLITLGSPLQGGVGETAFGWRVGAEERDQSRREAAAREERPLEVPALSIYTRGDGVVAWTSSRDPMPGRTASLEVASCHCGLVMNPQVWVAIAEALTDSAGRA